MAIIPEAYRDQNRATALIAISNDGANTIVPLEADPATGRLLVNSTGGGSSASVGLVNTTAPGSADQIGIVDAGGLLQPVSSTNPIPISGSISATNPSVGTDNATAPTSDTLIGTVDGGGLIQHVSPSNPLPAVLKAGSAIVGKVTTDQTTHGITDLVAADITKVAGASIATGPGTASGAIRVELPTDGTGTVNANVNGTQSLGLTVNTKPIMVAGISAVTLQAAIADHKAATPVTDRHSRLLSIKPSVTTVSSAATPITTNTNTSIVSAPGAGTHLKVYRILAQNSSATATWLYWTEGSGGTKKFPMYLLTGQVISFNLEGSWELPSATALYINTTTTGANIEWEVSYETVTD